MAASEVSDGPVLSVINKRLRALRKKHNRILQMEENLINGKALNKEQEETFRSKPVVLACIDELEKLRQPLAAAVSEEINLATTTTTQQRNQNQACDVRIESEKLKDLLGLIYFGNMFDHAKWHHHQSGEFVSTTMLQRTMHERACCLNYDCMPYTDTDDDGDDDDDSSDVLIDLLSENDLDLISMLSDLLISRPVNSTLSHKHALQTCIEHANLWLTKSDQPIGPESNATYAGLRLKLNKIISSLYFTRDPVFKVEEVVANYGSYLVQGEESVGVMPVDAPDAPAVQFQQKEEQAVSSQANDSKEIQGSTVEEVQQEQEGNFSEQLAGQEEDTYDTGGVDNLKEADYKDQQAIPFDQETVPLRSYQNYRGNHSGGGGIRRGYSNGRGGRGRGGSYQNGRNQYNDQSGNYYQKNYYNNRGRGGRGTDGGGNYGHHASGGQAGTFYADS